MRRLYEYVCDCGEEKEALREYEDKEPIPCPHCGGKMVRVISVPRVLKPNGEEGQSLKAIHEIQRNDRNKKERIWSRP